MPTSQSTSLVDALRAEGIRRGLDSATVDAKLQAAGYLDAPAVASSGGGPGLGQQMLHGAGLIARMGLQGVGNMASLPFGMAGAAYQGITGNEPPAMLQGQQGTAAADQIGLPQPQGAGERIVTAAGENAVGAGILPGATPALAALGAASGTAGQVTQEMGGGPLAQMAASAAVGMGIPVVGKMGAAAIRAAIAGSAARRQAAEQSLALMRAGEPNAAVSLGQVAEGGAARLMQGGLRNVPGASEVFKANAERQAKQMGQRAAGIADELSPVGNATTAGAAIQTGLKEGFIPRFKAVANRMYERVWSLMPPDTPIQMPATVKLHADMGSLGAGAEALKSDLSNPKVAGILERLAQALDDSPNGAIPFQVAKQLRSRLGAMLNGDELVTDVNLGDVKRIYGALSQDMRAGIAQSNPRALPAWDRAEAFWRQGSEKIEKILQPLMDKKTPEAAFTALFSGSRDGSTVLRSTMRSLSGAERGVIQSAAVRRMGLANPGAQDAVGDIFSPETFLTRWNQLAPASRDALFEGADPRIVGNLNRLAKAAEIRKSAARVLPNPSGTAPNTAFWAAMSGLGTSVAGTVMGNPTVALGGLAPAGVIGGSNLLARAFTSPRITNWLVRQTRLPFGALTQELALLAKDAQKWPEDDRETAQEISQSLSNVDWRSVMMAQAVADASGRAMP